MTDETFYEVVGHVHTEEDHGNLHIAAVLKGGDGEYRIGMRWSTTERWHILPRHIGAGVLASLYGRPGSNRYHIAMALPRFTEAPERVKAGNR